MKFLRTYLCFLMGILSVLNFAQDFQLNTIRQFGTGSGSSGFPAVINGVPFAVLNGNRSINFGSADRFFSVTVADSSQEFKLDFVQPGPSSTVVVVGRLRTNPPLNDRLAVFKINVATESLDWTFVEPVRSVSTKALNIIDTGVSLVVAAAVEGGVAAIALNPANGTEQYRTSVATTLQDGAVARDGQENIFLVTNRVVNGVSNVFVRSVDAQGFFRWERDYAIPGTAIQAFDFSIPLLVIAHDQPGTKNHVLELDLANGNLLRSFTFFGDGSSVFGRPAAVRVAGGVLMHFLVGGAVQPIGRRMVRVDLSNFSGTVQFQAGDPFDQRSVATLFGVPVFHAVNLANFNLELFPDSTWAPSSLPVGVDIQRAIVADPARNRLLTVLTEPSNAVPRLAEIIPKPIARDDSVEAFFNELQVTFDVTANDIAAASSDLEILSQPAGGTVSQNNDGTLTFTANAAKHQTETFEYRLVRGNLSTIATVKIFRQPVGVGIDLSASRVKGGTLVTGKVRMSGPRQGAPQLLEVFENSSATALAAPTVELLPGKSESEVFTVFTARVRNPVRAIITADEGNFSVEEIAALDIDPPFLTALEAIETTVVGGVPASFRVVLDAPAPTGGMPVSVSDNSPAIAVPSVMVVPAGQAAGVFSAPTAAVTSSRTAVVTVTSNGDTRSVTIAIVGVSVILDPTSVVGGNPSTGTITLTSNAINNSVVFNLSDNSTATAPQTPTAIVPAGFRTGTFTVLTVPVTSTRSSTINVSKSGVTRSATMTIRVAALLSILVSPSQVAGGSPFAGLVSLDGKAAGAGLTVGLSSAAAFAQVPSSLLIVGGQSQGLFVGTTTRPSTTLMIVITASLNGVTRATTIIVSP